MRILPTFVAAVAISVIIACKSKQHVTETRVGEFSEHFRHGSTELRLDDVITIFDILVNDSDTVAKPRQKILRQATIKEDTELVDTVSKVMGFSKQEQSVAPRSSRDGHLSPKVIYGIVLGFCVLLFLKYLLKIP